MEDVAEVLAHEFENSLRVSDSQSRCVENSLDHIFARHSQSLDQIAGRVLWKVQESFMMLAAGQTRLERATCWAVPFILEFCRG